VSGGGGNGSFAVRAILHFKAFPGQAAMRAGRRQQNGGRVSAALINSSPRLRDRSAARLDGAFVEHV